jgi:hypothetical protein
VHSNLLRLQSVAPQAINPTLHVFPGSSPVNSAHSSGCEVVAHAWVRVGLDALPGLRRQPGPLLGETLSPAFLKHADEQTVVAMAAVSKALTNPQLLAWTGSKKGFHDWGALAAPRFLGRAAITGALERFRSEGAWGVSPHLIPHRSLHSISGTISQALKIHGPNFGVGGGPNGVGAALLAAIAMIEMERLPGVWVVLTCIDPEHTLPSDGSSAEGTFLAGLALALVPPTSGSDRIRIRLLTSESPNPAAPRPQSDLLTLSEPPPAVFEAPHLAEVLEALAKESPAESTLVQSLDCGQRIELGRKRVGPLGLYSPRD